MDGMPDLRDDEIAYLGRSRCYCGHLTSLHDDDGCLVDNYNHHFCSADEERQHFEVSSRERGNPALNRPVSCPSCS